MPENEPKEVAKKLKRDYGYFRDDAGGDKDSSWLIVYSDMMTLLMTFFVLLWSMSTPDPTKYKEMMRHVGDALGADKGGFEAVEEETLESLMKKIKTYIEGENLSNDIFIEKESRGVLIYTGSDIAFEPEGAELREETKIFLKNISKILKKSSYKITIEGHTDDVPFQSEKFPSNWELSTSRASAAARYFIDTGNIAPQRIITAGYAGFKPRFPATPENRAKNQRIEIIVMKEKF